MNSIERYLIVCSQQIKLGKLFAVSTELRISDYMSARAADQTLVKFSFSKIGTENKSVSAVVRRNQCRVQGLDMQKWPSTALLWTSLFGPVVQVSFNSRQ